MKVSFSVDLVSPEIVALKTDTNGPTSVRALGTTDDAEGMVVKGGVRSSNVSARLVGAGLNGISATNEGGKEEVSKGLETKEVGEKHMLAPS